MIIIYQICTQFEQFCDWMVDDWVDAYEIDELAYPDSSHLIFAFAEKKKRIQFICEMRKLLCEMVG